MKTKRYEVWLIGVLLGLGMAIANSVFGQVWVNSGSGTFEWQDPSNWGLGAPSVSQPATLITNAVSGLNGFRFRTVSIDSTTSGGFPGTMTINDLTVSAPGSGLSGSHNALFLNDAGLATPLDILDTLTISSGGAVNITNSALQIDGQAAAFFPDDGTVTLYTGALLITTNASTAVGYMGSGNFTVYDGTWLADNVTVGFSAGSVGTLTVAGGAVTITSPLATLQLGNPSAANGTVLLTGGQLTSTNSETDIGLFGIGQMTVTGGSWRARDVRVASYNGSRGTLTIDGGVNTLSGSLIVGANAVAATGTVWMTGGELTITNGSTATTCVSSNGVGQMIVSNGLWQTSFMAVANQPGSDGTLTIAGGTNIVMVSAVIGNDAQSTGSVWMTGGSLVAINVQGTVALGGSGVGQLTVSNGTWQSPDVTVASTAGSQGTLTVAGGTFALTGSMGQESIFRIGNAGTGSVWLTSGLLIATNTDGEVGWYGIGQMTVSNGTWLAGDVTVGYKVDSEGTLTVAGGTNVFWSFLTVGGFGTGTAWLTGGQLVVTNGSSAVGSGGVGFLAISNGTWLARDVSVGNAHGAQGTLTVAGGTSSAYTSLTIGRSDCTGTGTVIVTGGSLLVTNAAHDAVLDLESGTLILNGGTLVADALVKTNPCGFFAQTGGTLIVGGVTNALAPFEITAIHQEGNNVRVTWTGAGGDTDVVQVTNGSTGNYVTNFTDLSPPIVLSGFGNVTTNYFDVGGATNRPARYYRVRLVP